MRDQAPSCRSCFGEKIKMLSTRRPPRLLNAAGVWTVIDLQQDKQNQRAVLIGPCAHTIRDKDLSEGNKKARGMTVPEDGGRYQPVAWWFTKRRLGRELRNLYQATEELPPRLLALVSKLEGKPDTPLEAKGEGGGSARHQ